MTAGLADSARRRRVLLAIFDGHGFPDLRRVGRLRSGVTAG